MTPLRALVLFPVRPGPASAALARRTIALAAPLVPALVLTILVAARGAGPLDALATGAGLLLLVAGTGLGGLLGCYPGKMILGRPYDAAALAGPCVVCAAWTAVLFLGLLAVGKIFGAGAAAALFS
ncbi:MAG: hypothetical protein OER88_12945, partial [Planctomycetota bacterium]|nr:hypothetical protein [Planctomycetota bacterium]